jgi:AcrR family transcriptional regulator
MSAPRGRPKQFDPDTALEQIAGVFWDKGFAGASIDDLTAAAGIKRPSLYASFGDKRTSFLAALAMSRGRLQKLIAEFDASPKLRSGLTKFFEDNIIEYTQGTEGPRGCFILTVAIEAVAQEDVRILLASILGELDAVFRRRFAKAIQDGEIAKTSDPISLAMMAVSTLQGLALRARAGASVATLQELAHSAAIGLSQPATSTVAV